MNKIIPKHIIGGEGDKCIDIYLTLDLIPIRFTIRYNEVVTTYKTEFGDWPLVKKPSVLSNIYTKDVYQELINIVCKELNLEKRELKCFGNNRRLPNLQNVDFKKDDLFYEFQFGGDFGVEYYSECKLKNALKFNDTKDSIYNLAKNVHAKYHEYRDRMDEEECKMIGQLNAVFSKMEKQKVLKNKDYISISKTTIDNFIKTLEVSK